MYSESKHKLTPPCGTCGGTRFVNRRQDVSGKITADTCPACKPPTETPYKPIADCQECEFMGTRKEGFTHSRKTKHYVEFMETAETPRSEAEEFELQYLNKPVVPPRAERCKTCGSGDPRVGFSTNAMSGCPDPFHRQGEKRGES
jgi:hypothetical protein